MFLDFITRNKVDPFKIQKLKIISTSNYLSPSYHKKNHTDYFDENLFDYIFHKNSIQYVLAQLRSMNLDRNRWAGTRRASTAKKHHNLN